MTSRVDYIKETIFGMISDVDNETDREYYMLHLYTVACFSAVLASRRHLDPDLAMTAGLLHDVYSLQHGYSEAHGPLGAQVAGKILAESGRFSSQDIEVIVEAIARHSDKEAIDGAYAEVLKDADVLEMYLHKESNKSLMGEAKLSRVRKLLDGGADGI